MSDCTHSNAAETFKIQMSNSESDGDEGDETNPGPLTCCVPDPFYRRRSIISVVCGCNCIGYRALIYSVKAEEAPSKFLKDKLSRKAKKLTWISFAVFAAVLVSIPVLMAFISYLITLKD